MDLTVIPTPVLEGWLASLYEAIGRGFGGRQETSLSVSQGAGSRSVSYAAVNTLMDAQNWVGRIQAELARRGLMNAPARTRRAIGIRF